jgi:hypothetical protein
MFSPFASDDTDVRERAACAFVLNADEALRGVQERIAKGIGSKEHWAVRTQALRNNRQGWLDYIGNGCPRVSGAVKDPRLTNH